MWLIFDDRIPARTVYQCLRDDESLMRVPDEVIKSAVFLAYWNGKEHKLVGTGFFVGMSLESMEEKAMVYLVTAKHVIERIEIYSHDGLVYMRTNLRESKMQWFSTKIDSWYFHPNDSTVDVAVFPFWNDRLDHKFWPTKTFVTDEVIKREGIGIGEEVFITGLFGRHAGSQKNLPIVRVGNIAAMPDEPINAKWALMKAYLVEVRSVGGISGSPVIVSLSAIRNIEGTPKLTLKSGGSFYLLGLIHGHWNKRVAETDMIAVDEDYAESLQLLNMGIAIVVPASTIIGVLNHPALKEGRKKEVLRLREETGATADVIVESKETETFTKQVFEEALKKVSSIKKPDEEKGE